MTREVRVHIWHDSKGAIIAVGRPMFAPKAGRHATPIAGKNQIVLETEVPEDQVKVLHRTHIVDVEKKALKAR